MTERPRPPVILDVNPDFDSLDDEVALFESRGLSVERCRGPASAVDCPVLRGKACPKALKADLILCQLDLDNDEHRTIVEGYRRDGRRLVLVVSPEEVDHWPSLLGDAGYVAGPPDDAALEEIASLCI